VSSLGCAIFGVNLRRARERLGLTQQQLADAAGSGRSYISAIEGGMENLSIQTAEALAEAVGMSIQQLFDPSPTQAPKSPKTTPPKK
jgi:transcriptional regulator with XRE-family HTH domain